MSVRNALICIVGGVSMLIGGVISGHSVLTGDPRPLDYLLDAAGVMLIAFGILQLVILRQNKQ